MSTPKSSFVLYNELINTTDKLSDEEAGKLFKIILAKVNGREYEIEDRVMQLVFIPIEQTLSRNLQKYENKLKEKSHAGIIGNLKRWNPDIHEDYIKGKIDLDKALDIAKSRKHRSSDKDVANIAVNDSVHVPENVPENENVDVDEKLLSLNAAAKVFCNNEKVIQAIYKDNKLKVGTQQSLIANIKDFILHLEQKNISEKTSKDFREHFISWLRKKEEGKRASTKNKKVGGYSSEDVERIHSRTPKF